MAAALASISTRISVPELKHISGFSADLSLAAVLDALGKMRLHGTTRSSTIEA